MAEPFLAEIIMFGGNFAPRGWALCDGQLLPISQYSALFSLLGTTYGGDGRTTFALPDLRGRVAIHPGNGAGLSPYDLGEKGGAETNTIHANQLPAHNHPMQTATAPADTANSLGNSFGGALNYVNAAATQKMNTSSIGNNATPNESVNNRQPYLCVNFIIAMQGTFPSRS